MNISDLPEDIVLHISGYYGVKIPINLSIDIKEQKYLQIIKENEYYDETCRIWKTRTLFSKIGKEDLLTEKIIWKQHNKLFTLLWRSYTSKDRTSLIENYFPYVQIKEPDFTTGREFIKSKTGYYID
uniref:Uncharacterized protein n=1 Tax=viral metagenome TaxID=1070528 RepID=A0A6C0JJ51_9ZZZZ